MMLRRWLATVTFFVSACPILAQVIAPVAPAEYDVQIRYRIRATRNQRIEQYFDMTKTLDAAGLKREPEEEDAATNASAERIRGKLAASAVPAVLAQQYVRSMIVTPAGMQLPAGDGKLLVRITLPHGLVVDRQQLLHAQSIERLGKLGFVSRVGYDHRGFTMLFGTLPAGNLANLIGDVRHQPGGWLVADTGLDNLPEPLRSYDPIRLVEVIGEPKDIAAVADVASPKVAPELAKLSDDLRRSLQQQGDARKPTRLEVILFDPVNSVSPLWRSKLQGAGALTIEGRLGQTVTIVAPTGAAKDIAALPEVASVRLPARADEPIALSDLHTGGNPLGQSRVDSLHGLNARGQGVTIAIVDSDFAGIKRFLGKSLSNTTLFVDMTAERNQPLEPDPLPADRPGRGTLSALAAAQSAPMARLILVRVDAAAAYQVGAVAQFVAGESFRSESMLNRHSELLLDNESIRQQREAINEERRLMSENFSSEDDVHKKRLDLQKRLADQHKRETDYSNRLARFVALEKGLLELRTASVVACNLSWNVGFATDGTNPLAAYLDGSARLHDRGGKLGPVAWLQSAGDTHSQTWAAPAWDADGNGVLEFGNFAYPMPGEKWTRELNFIGWQLNDGTWSPDLPAGTKFRLTLQWTEAHDATAPVPASRYRKPLNDLQPVIVKQRDPSGKATSSDDLVIVACAAPLAQLIGRSGDSATFEQSIELNVEQSGRFAVRLEGKLATSTAPAEIELPPAARKSGEVFPRLFVDVANRDKGRPIFIDFRTVAGGVAMPGDARSVVVIAAANNIGQLQHYSARGSSPSLALVQRPSFIVFDEMTLGNLPARGTATANGFAAGLVATMLSAGGPPSHSLSWLSSGPAGLLEVPSRFVEHRLRSTSSQSGVSYPASPVVQPDLHNR